MTRWAAEKATYDPKRSITRFDCLGHDVTVIQPSTSIVSDREFIFKAWLTMALSSLVSGQSVDRSFVHVAADVNGWPSVSPRGTHQSLITVCTVVFAQHVEEN